MLVAEARYLGVWLAITAAILVPMVAALSIARAAHLPAWSAFALCLVMICGIAFAALTLWLRSLRDGSATKAAEPAERPARIAPLIIQLAVFIIQGVAIVLTFNTFAGSNWTRGADTFAFSCISTAVTVFLAVREWRSTIAKRSGSTPIPPFTQNRLAQLSAAHGGPTQAARVAALRPLRVRGALRLALIPLEVVLMLMLAPKIGISLAFLSSFTIVAGIFIIGYKFFDL